MTSETQCRWLCFSSGIVLLAIICICCYFVLQDQTDRMRGQYAMMQAVGVPFKKISFIQQFHSEFVLEIHRNRYFSQHRCMLWYLDYDAGIKHVLCGFFIKVVANFAVVSYNRNYLYGHCNSAAHDAAAYKYACVIEPRIKRI